jgi:hypothetical protein
MCAFFCGDRRCGVETKSTVGDVVLQGLGSQSLPLEMTSLQWSIRVNSHNLMHDEF